MFMEACLPRGEGTEQQRSKPGEEMGGTERRDEEDGEEILSDNTLQEQKNNCGCRHRKQHRVKVESDVHSKPTADRSPL